MAAAVIIGQLIGVALGLAGIVAFYTVRYRRMVARHGGTRRSVAADVAYLFGRDYR